MARYTLETLLRQSQPLTSNPSLAPKWIALAWVTAESLPIEPQTVRITTDSDWEHKYKALAQATMQQIAGEVIVDTHTVLELVRKFVSARIVAPCDMYGIFLSFYEKEFTTVLTTALTAMGKDEETIKTLLNRETVEMLHTVYAFTYAGQGSNDFLTMINTRDLSSVQGEIQKALQHQTEDWRRAQVEAIQPLIQIAGWTFVKLFFLASRLTVPARRHESEANRAISECLMQCTLKHVLGATVPDDETQVEAVKLAIQMRNILDGIEVAPERPKLALVSNFKG